MATTVDLQQPIYDSAIQQVVCPTLAASTTIPMGAIAMCDSSGRAVNFVDSTFQGGDIGCLGVAVSRYSNNTASAVSKRMLFVRNCPAILVGKGGDAPTATNLGEKIALSDNGTCKATIASGDFEVTLLEVLGGNRFRVWIP